MRSSTKFILLHLCFLALAVAQSSLPVVDLGYQLHQASSFNETGGFYNFSNIRYAAAPTGNLRFRAPQLPSSNRSVIQTGSVGRICPQGNPAWLPKAEAFAANYSQGLPFIPPAYSSSNISSSNLPTDPRITEDCLFLDVVVPQNILAKAGNSSGVPVLIWIHGGGYTIGSKDQYGPPAGLLARASNGIVFVSLNYRLGAFGFISGPTLQADGVANAGLLDQRLALQWVQEHISKFGGDPQNVTVMGESAGGGSILHHITAFGGVNSSSPFRRAILQSPAFHVFKSSSQQESYLQGFLALLNVSTVAAARTLPSSDLIAANTAQNAANAYGDFMYGPVIDGSLVPNLPGLLLSSGQFDHSVEVMVGHNADEGALFTYPAITTSADFNASVSRWFPVQNKSTLEYIESTIYPPVFDGTQPYTNNLDRAVLMSAEMIITCNTFYLNTAFDNLTHAYLFATPPALHASDLVYTFYDGPYDASANTASFNATVATALQDYITSFAMHGMPTTDIKGVPIFTTYGKGAVILDLNSTGISEMTDPTANDRCRWWQLGLYATD